ncbi:tRNA pseudouridine(38-40) synthase TruA [Lichenihabitans sp. PAMC28606]|uniref:tRNA pseudouridine(38-40) synthase TruA n=1 Tax=Lichenihabitans sp. PAMC28606 TaxID=2880932 RepID=UPI001D09B925|nr:tRNA pseudouridine(38-40) synthase TruA [Lichenihabitans sp. PAMC28606]UDL95944.1 tRNA pseudouridine(38-40) synthase TruA [Lichenihabitans sp. PAMC28606]
MPRFKLTVEYDGTAFVGWQRQANGPSIQGEIERAAEALSGAPVMVKGAGRTDAGVHATGQVAHLDFIKPYRSDSVRDALNAHLRPHPISVLKAEEVGPDFDARSSATRRHYLYRIVNRRPPLALSHDRAWLVKRRLDAGAMHEAGQALIGRHDFTTFRDADCQAISPIRTLDRIEVSQEGDRIDIRVTARSFLHRQVRSMVGSLEFVGAGKWSTDELRAALEARDRSRCGTVAPAAGLYLARVDYAG